ncbi:hypothetical protein B0181_03265 [Moraxella caviae]|uniref:Amino acid permease n=1 Tax=Moraxella caviae TaxID=34060 RepID=A0A1T0A6H3_9GAMM|nr:APC family permease [Moraxella caviae]OOR91336.1 hypothetical protein B0181_03265 [Moraxella caviae]STZ13946.1 Amino acid permease [Moraxella caviae]VEW11118.1 Amino acid permease [Moraxella caviae]
MPHHKPAPQLTALHAIAISVGAMIGWGAFVMPGDLFLNKTNLLGSSLAFLLGTAIILLVSRSYIEMMGVRTHGTNSIAWIAHYFGKTHAKIYGAGVFLGYLAIIALNATAITLLIRYSLPAEFQLGFLYQIHGWDMYLSEFLAGALMVVLFAWLNFKGVRSGANVQLVISLLLVSVIVFLTAYSLWAHEASTNLAALSAQTQHSLSAANLLPNLRQEFANIGDGWLLVLAVVPWAYVGFETTPHITKNIQASKIKSRQIVYLSIFSGLLCYLLVNYFTALNLNFDYAAITNSAWATGEGVRVRLGDFGFGLLLLAMACAILSGINGFTLSAVKLLENMADADILPKKLAQNTTHKLTFIAIASVCIAATLLGRNHLATLVNLASLGIAFGFSYVVCTHIAYQKSKIQKLDKISMAALLASLWFVWLIL